MKPNWHRVNLGRNNKTRVLAHITEVGERKGHAFVLASATRLRGRTCLVLAKSIAGIVALLTFVVIHQTGTPRMSDTTKITRMLNRAA